MEGLYFECKKCGNCCKTVGHTILTVYDIRRISNFLNINIDVFLKEYCYIFRRSVYSNKILSFVIDEISLKKQAKKCPFLKDNYCSIQNVKPLYCKNYPFIASLEYLSYFRVNIKHCRGFDCGRFFMIDEIKNKLEDNNNQYYNYNKEIIEMNYDWKQLFGNIYSYLIIENENIQEDELYRF